MSVSHGLGIGDGHLEEISRSASPWLWVIAIAFYGVGDVATTIAFIEAGIAEGEAHPVAAVGIEAVGTWILVVWKAAALALLFGVYRLVERVAPSSAVGVPLGTALLGMALTLWNTIGAILGHNPLPII